MRVALFAALLTATRAAATPEPTASFEVLARCPDLICDGAPGQIACVEFNCDNSTNTCVSNQVHVDVVCTTDDQCGCGCANKNYPFECVSASRPTPTPQPQPTASTVPGSTPQPPPAVTCTSVCVDTDTPCESNGQFCVCPTDVNDACVALPTPFPPQPTTAPPTTPPPTPQPTKACDGEAPRKRSAGLTQKRTARV